MNSLIRVLAADTPSPSPVPTGLPRELDPNIVTPGLVGLVFFVALFLALFFLMRSFTRQLRRIDIPDGGVPTHGETEPERSSGNEPGEPTGSRPGD